MIIPNSRTRQSHPARLSRLIAFLVPAVSSPSRRRSAIAHRSARRAALCGGSAIALMIGGAGALAEPTIAPPQDIVFPGDRVAIFIEEAAYRFGVPGSWIRAVMQVESNGDVRAASPEGAIGLMQIMPQTWAELRARYRLGVDPHDAHDNIVAGSAYIRELWERYGAPGFLAAYNAGPARYEDHLATGRPLPAETQAYVARLTPALTSAAIDDVMVVASAARSWTRAPLFTDHPANVSAQSDPHLEPSPAIGADDHPAAFATHSDGLFVTTSHRRSRP